MDDALWCILPDAASGRTSDAASAAAEGRHCAIAPTIIAIGFLVGVRFAPGFPQAVIVAAPQWS